MNKPTFYKLVKLVLNQLSSRKHSLPIVLGHHKSVKDSLVGDKNPL